MDFAEGFFFLPRFPHFAMRACLLVLDHYNLNDNSKDLLREYLLIISISFFRGKWMSIY